MRLRAEWLYSHFGANALQLHPVIGVLFPVKWVISAWIEVLNFAVYKKTLNDIAYETKR